MADKIKLSMAFLLVVAGIAGYYVLSDSAAVLRLASVLLGFMMAAGVLWTTEPGKLFFAYSKDSVDEAKRVVWPTRKTPPRTAAVRARRSRAIATGRTR